MSNIRNHRIEPAKENEGNVMLDAYTIQMKHHEKAFLDFTRCHKSKEQHLQTKIKSLIEEDQKLQKTLLQRDAIIKELRENIDARNKEILRLAETKDSLNEENKTLKQNLLTNEKKFTFLETSYDQNVASFRSELKEKRQEIESQNIKYNHINDELIKSRKNHAESIDGFQKLQEEFNNYKFQSTKEYETNLTTLKDKMADLSAKLLQKDEELAQIREEKHKMEEAKNKIIDEQTFKINRIERVFEQPLQRVQPHVNTPTTPLLPASPTQVGRSYQLTNDQYSVSMSTSTTCATVTALPTNADPPVRSRSARTMHHTRQRSQASQTKDAASSSNNAAAVEAAASSTKSVKRRLMANENFSTDSDSDSIVSIASTNFLNNTRRNRCSNTPMGFGSLKRTSAASSDSSRAFDNLKRSKYE